MPSIYDRYALHFLLRPRVVARLADASMRPIVLLAAGAGWGKSVALDQYLQSLGHAYRRVDARDERAMANIDTSLAGVVAIEGLEKARASAVAELVGVIERTKRQIQWVVATRSLVGLPVGTWLANHDVDLPIAASDLRFTFEEALECVREHAGTSDREIVREIVDVTDGWPMAIAVAFRALRQTSDVHEIRALIRDAAFHYLSEQVYPDLEDSERELLSVAAVLTEIDVDVLEHAGFSNARRMLDAIRGRTGLLTGLDADSFFMPRLLRDYLNRQTALGGAPRRAAVNRRAAQALEVAGNQEGALAAYGTAHAQSDLLRILEGNGFDLLERGRVDSVSQAIDTLDEHVRRSNPRVLALRGVLQSLAGKPIRAETLLRRALAHADDDRDLHAAVTFRLALLLTNRGADIYDLLRPIADDESLSASRRSEALSIFAARSALAGRTDSAQSFMKRAEDLLDVVENDSIRAKVLQRLGVASMYVGDSNKARVLLSQAADTATELQMHSLASRAYANLSNLMLHSHDDVEWQLWYARQASASAVKAGDAFDLETSLLQLLDAELRCGNIDESAAIEGKLSSARSSDQSRFLYLAPSKALRLAWNGQFAEAHRMLTDSWKRLHHEIDRIVSGAECALFLALDKRRSVSLTVTKEVTRLTLQAELDGPFERRSIGMAQMCCALAEAINGRFAHAERIIAQIGSGSDDAVTTVMSRIATDIATGLRGSDTRLAAKVALALKRLSDLGYVHLTRLLQSVLNTLEASASLAEADQLTNAERSTIRLLAEGLSPKEIALRRGCSVNTVRTHIANVILKFRCNGRVQAIAISRRVGILD